VIAALLAASVALTPAAPADEVVARVGAHAITAADLEAAAARRLIEVQTREHDLKRQALEDLVERSCCGRRRRAGG